MATAIKGRGFGCTEEDGERIKICSHSLRAELSLLDRTRHLQSRKKEGEERRGMIPGKAKRTDA